MKSSRAHLQSASSCQWGKPGMCGLLLERVWKQRHSAMSTLKNLKFEIERVQLVPVQTWRERGPNESDLKKTTLLSRIVRYMQTMNGVPFLDGGTFQKHVTIRDRHAEFTQCQAKPERRLSMETTWSARSYRIVCVWSNLLARRHVRGPGSFEVGSTQQQRRGDGTAAWTAFVGKSANHPVVRHAASSRHVDCHSMENTRSRQQRRRKQSSHGPAVSKGPSDFAWYCKSFYDDELDQRTLMRREDGNRDDALDVGTSTPSDVGLKL